MISQHVREFICSSVFDRLPRATPQQIETCRVVGFDIVGFPFQLAHTLAAHATHQVFGIRADNRRATEKQIAFALSRGVDLSKEFDPIKLSISLPSKKMEQCS